MKERRIKSLKEYLIKRFIQIILFVAISEGVLSLIFSEFFYPFISKFLTFTNIRPSSFSSGYLPNVIPFCVAMIGICMLSIMPEVLSEAITGIFHYFGIDIVGISLNFGSPYLGKVYYFGLILVFLIILILILSPYIIAAITFGRMVTKKVATPFRYLTEGMEQVMEGDLDTRLTFDTEYEFIQMQQTFNKMSAQMEQDFNDKLEFEKMRSGLFSDIAHDLKTPITTIAGYATALADGLVTDPEKQMQYLEAIKAKSLKMDQLIMLLFEYVKLDSEGFSLNQEEVDIAETLRESIAILYTDFEEKNIDVIMDIPEKSIRYSADSLQFSRVFSNLLTNALRYNEAGSKVWVSLTAGKEGIQISIGDNGVAIPSQVADRIFEPFVRGDESRSTKSGSGLGLSIAKKIVVMHGGTLTFNDRIIGDEIVKAFVINLPH